EARANAGNQPGGDIRVRALVGDIRIDGPVNADSRSTSGTSPDGSLDLQADNGSIVIGGLDVNKFLTTTFSVGSGGRVEISGPLENLGVAGSDVSGFGSINSHVFYNAGQSPALFAGGVNGRYNITDSGGVYDLIPLSGIFNTFAGNVTPTSADLHATILNTGEIFQVFAYWGDTDGGTDASAWDNNGSAGFFVFPGTMPVVLPIVHTLALNETNYYTFRISNATHDVWASPSAPILPGRPPIIDQSSLGDQAVLSGVPYNGPTPLMTQTGIPPHMWTLNTGPAGMTVNMNSGVVSWPAPINGLHMIEIVAANPWGADTSSWNLVVSETLTMTNKSTVPMPLLCDPFDLPPTGANPYLYEAQLDLNMASHDVCNPPPGVTASFEFNSITNGTGGNFFFQGTGIRGHLIIETTNDLHVRHADNSSDSADAGDITLLSRNGDITVQQNLIALGDPTGTGDDGGMVDVTADNGQFWIENEIDVSGGGNNGDVNVRAQSITIGTNVMGWSIRGHSFFQDAADVLLDASVGDVTVLGRIDVSTPPAQAADVGGGVAVNALNGVIRIDGGVDTSAGSHAAGKPIRLEARQITIGSLDGAHSILGNSTMDDGADLTLIASAGNIDLDGGINVSGDAVSGGGSGDVTLEALNGNVFVTNGG
ncbi:MAG: hypothetical protein AAF492_14010, partial [Verrucomicrobiota bacterium]